MGASERMQLGGLESQVTPMEIILRGRGALEESGGDQREIESWGRWGGQVGEDRNEGDKGENGAWGEKKGWAGKGTGGQLRT